MNKNNFNFWSEAAITCAGQLFPMKSEDPDTFNKKIWDECSHLLPHILTVAQFGQKFSIKHKETSNLFIQAASFMREQAYLNQAKEYAEKGLEVSKKIRPKDLSQCSVYYENYARILRDVGDLPSAKEYITKAIEFNKNNVGSEDSHLAICYDNLGRIFDCLDNPIKAIEYFEKALEIDRKIWGEEHPKIAIRLNNIACALIKIKEYEKAKENIKKAIEIEENGYNDPDHPYIAIRYVTLGRLFLEMKLLDNAIPCCERAIKITKNFYGKDHPIMSEPLYLLGVIMAEKGDFEAAKLYFQTVITINEMTTNPEHILLKPAYDNLGEVFLKLNDIEQAKRCFSKAK
jgi:tetratricopeptide (TPR) repeat protein